MKRGASGGEPSGSAPGSAIHTEGLHLLSVARSAAYEAPCSAFFGSVCCSPAPRPHAAQPRFTWSNRLTIHRSSERALALAPHVLRNAGTSTSQRRKVCLDRSRPLSLF